MNLLNTRTWGGTTEKGNYVWESCLAYHLDMIRAMWQINEAPTGRLLIFRVLLQCSVSWFVAISPQQHFLFPSAFNRFYSHGREAQPAHHFNAFDIWWDQFQVWSFKEGCTRRRLTHLSFTDTSSWTSHTLYWTTPPVSELPLVVITSANVMLCFWPCLLFVSLLDYVFDCVSVNRDTQKLRSIFPQNLM